MAKKEKDSPRGRSKSRSKSKRRRAPSPAASDSSDSRIAREYIESTKRIKREQSVAVNLRSVPQKEAGVETTSSGRPAEGSSSRPVKDAVAKSSSDIEAIITSSSPVSVVTPGTSSDREAPSCSSTPIKDAAKKKPSNVSPSQVQEYETPATSPSSRCGDSALDSSNGHLFEILRDCCTSSIKLKGRIEEVIDIAFRVPSKLEDDTPGWLHIQRVLSELRSRGVSTKRTDELKSAFAQAWRKRMGKYIARDIVTSIDLRDALSAVVGTLSPRPGRNGIVADVLAYYQAQQCEDGPSMKVKSATSLEDVKFEAHQRQVSSLSAFRESSNPAVDRKQRCQEASNAKADAGASSKTTIPDVPRAMMTSPGSSKATCCKERFPEVFDAFFHHVNRCRVVASKTPRHNDEDHRKFTEQVRLIFGRLRPSQLQQWREVHRKMVASNLTPVEVPRRLLREHKVLAELSIDLPIERSVTSRSKEIPIKIPRASGEPPSLGATMIPFVKQRGPDKKNRIMMLVNTPDVPYDDITEEELYQACTLAFAPSSLEKVEKWNDRIMVATFAFSSCVRRVKGRLVHLGGVRITAGHFFSKPPTIFVCDVKGMNLNEDEIGRRVAEAFADCEVKPTLHLQECPKLYAGRSLRLSLPRGMHYVRIYIPIIEQDPKRKTVLCFQALNPTVPCILCDYDHGLKVCEFSREIVPPSMR